MTEILFVQGPVEVAIAECTEGMFIRKKCVVKANKKGPSLQVNDEYCVLTHIWRRNGDISIQFPMSYGRTGDYYVLASEYAGVDLCKIWEKKGAFSINAILLMLYEAIKILAQLMELGVRHGDIKAQNLTCDENKCLKIIDFGNAEIKPKAHTPSGSPPYMARATHKGNTDHPSDDVEGILWTAAALMVPSGAKLPWFDQDKHTKLLSEKEAFVTNLSKNILPANMAGLKEHVAVFRDLFAAYDKLQTSPDREAYQNMREIIANAWEKFKLVPKIEEAKLGDLL
jgi:serine/threonine protein kinase